MELFLLLSIAYLIFTLIFSADRFIIQAAVFVVFGSAVTISMLLANEYLFIVFTTLATATLLPFFAKISFTDILKILLISFIATFWLTTAEFIDGFAYSQILIALGVAIASFLLFSPDNRQYCSLLSMLLPYAIIFAMGVTADLQEVVLAIAISWILTYRPTDKLAALNLFE